MKDNLSAMTATAMSSSIQTDKHRKEKNVMSKKSSKRKKSTKSTTYDWSRYALPKVLEKVPISITQNQTSLPEFIKLCKMTQKELKLHLIDELKTLGYDPIVDEGYIYAKGAVPVLLTAHLDTVHKQPVRNFTQAAYEDGTHRLSSPQGIGGDDRCGVYMILEIIKNQNCSIIFCEDEEIGCIGSQAFCRSKHIHTLNVNYMIGFDRTGRNDAVFYDCENDEFTKFITKTTGHIQTFGSFSDISYLAPMSRIAAVNLSCGYYRAHSLSEYVVIEEMLAIIETVKKLIDTPCEAFEYIEGISAYDHGNYEEVYMGYRPPTKGFVSYKQDTDFLLDISYIDQDAQMNDQIRGISEDACWCKFFITHSNICYDDVLDWYIY